MIMQGLMDVGRQSSRGGKTNDRERRSAVRLGL